MVPSTAFQVTATPSSAFRSLAEMVFPAESRKKSAVRLEVPPDATVVALAERLRNSQGVKFRTGVPEPPPPLRAGLFYRFVLESQ
jgi:hypothetical protein